MERALLGQTKCCGLKVLKVARYMHTFSRKKLFKKFLEKVLTSQICSDIINKLSQISNNA